MKKLNKLNINSDRKLNDTELILTKGGYDGGCSCTCTNGYAMAATSSEECEDFCNDLPGQGGVWRC